MSVDLARDIWNEVRGLLSTIDRADSAEHIVSILIEHDISLDEIKDTFKMDKDIKDALRDYIDHHEHDEWDDEDDHEDY